MGEVQPCNTQSNAGDWFLDEHVPTINFIREVDSWCPNTGGGGSLHGQFYSFDLVLIWSRVITSRGVFPTKVTRFDNDASQCKHIAPIFINVLVNSRGRVTLIKDRGPVRDGVWRGGPDVLVIRTEVVWEREIAAVLGNIGVQIGGWDSGGISFSPIGIRIKK